MKDFIIITKTDKIIFTHTSIVKAITVFSKMFEDEIVCICEVAWFEEVKAADKFLFHIGLS